MSKELTPFQSLSLVFGRLSQLKYWPGDDVLVFGVKATYARGFCNDFGTNDGK